MYQFKARRNTPRWHNDDDDQGKQGDALPDFLRAINYMLLQ